MRRHGLVLLCTLGLAALAASVAATVARAHSTPEIRAQQAHEREVLAEVNQIGNELTAVEDRAWNAQQQLNQVKQSLRENEYRLHVARGNLHSSQKRLMARLYSLYVDGSPSAIEAIAGAKTFGQIIDRFEVAHVLSNQDAALGEQALRFEHSVQARERQLKNLEAKRAAAARELEAEKQAKASELGRERGLLASIHTTISQLQAQEAAREQAARLAAEARLRAEEAARAARVRAAAARAAQTPPAQAATTSVVPPPISVPVGNGGTGHSAAASIALRYLGVPYVWGGASPSGFDCSGLVMYVYAQLGISLPHYTVAQWNATEPVSSPAPGDLVFFNGLGHVGIYIGGGQFVDAPHTGSVVRIDSMSGFGGYDGARRVP
ncbi:MAG TPA: NlpC/P60 family protein [Gaiellaceae bacterium]|jgi:cell wall-associated NlpC family hydrolase